MNKELDNTARDLISENAVRDALDQRSSVLPAETADGGDRADDHAASPARRPRRLRRWSVAELVARALARPPTGSVAH